MQEEEGRGRGRRRELLRTVTYGWKRRRECGPMEWRRLIHRGARC
jgi:hypothetical protein